MIRLVALATALFLTSGRLLAQSGAAPDAMSSHKMSSGSMSAMTMMLPLNVPSSRMGSGTSWVPDSTRVRDISTMRGAWMLSLQGKAYGQYVNQSTKRGDTQFGITDWGMLMAMRSVGTGQFRFNLMTTIEPLTIGGSGYPLLLQTGGTYQHSPLHDRQHPHDAVMELATSFEQPIANTLSLSAYAAAVGEPAIGPVASMHRPSAENDPLAPIGHHWQDASHQSFGVLTVGVNTRTLKLEGSLFNPREPDEHHLFMDYRGAKLDSYAGRITWAATPHVVASSWYGFLNSHERLDPTTRMHRYGASVLTQSRGILGGDWSSTFVWAMNLHHHGGASHELIHGAPGASPHHHASSLLAETNLGIGTRTSAFARIERVKKDGEELGFQGGDLTVLYDIRSIVLGGVRTIGNVANTQLAFGARGSINFVPQILLATYGTRTPSGFAVYAQLRAARRHSGQTHLH
ncbi:MAG: hypothetical protein ABI852_10370 [Gemmatimonadaceae bacterium]